MTSRTKRLRQLVGLQRQLKAIHEMRHAGFLREAASADGEASELMQHAEEGSTISELFPDLYAKRISAALARKDENTQRATTEAEKIAAETVRGNIVDRYYREARHHDERIAMEKEALEAITRKKPGAE